MYLLTDKPNHEVPFKTKEEKKTGGALNEDIFGSHFTDDPVGFFIFKFNSVFFTKITFKKKKKKF